MSRKGKFQYALEPVLLTRQWDLDALLLDLGRINESLAALRQELSALQEEINKTAAEWKQASQASAGLNVGSFAVVTRYMNDLAYRRSLKEQAIAAEEAARDELIDRVVAAQRGVEVVEQHRDEVKADFNTLRLSEEFKFADDHWSTLQGREKT